MSGDLWRANFRLDGDGSVRVWHRLAYTYRKRDLGVVHSVTVCGQDSSRMGYADPDPLKHRPGSRLCRKCALRGAADKLGEAMG